MNVRFKIYKKISPGLEFGLVGKTMHKVDEAVSLRFKKINKDLYNYFAKLF